MPSTATFEEIDLISEESVDRVLAKIRKRRRSGVASVIHLAAYFDLTGELEIPEPLAKAGAWVETDVLGEEPFIRPWMVDIANDHYSARNR